MRPGAGFDIHNTSSPQIRETWIASPDKWLYNSSTAFTISGDKTAVYTAGARVQLDNGTTKYATILSASYSSGATTVTLSGDALVDTSPLDDGKYTYSFFSPGGQTNPMILGGDLRVDGKIGVGCSPSIYGFEMHGSGTSLSRLQITNTNTAASNQGALLVLVSNDGTAMAAGERLGYFAFGGQRGDAIAHGVSLSGFCNTGGGWSSSDYGSRLEIVVVPDGASTAVKRVVVSQKTIADNTATGLFEIALPTGKMAGGTIQYTVTSSNGTDHHGQTGNINFFALNKGGVYSSNINATAPDAIYAESTAASTLSENWTITTGTNKVTINAAFDTSFNQPLSLKFTALIQTDQAVTML